MLNRLKEKEEEIQKVLDDLRVEAAKGTPILVEGKKDLDTLCSVGIDAKTLTVKTGGKSFQDITSMLEQSGTPEVILLLDFDRRGKQGTNRLRQSLEHSGIKVNLQFWRSLLRLAGKEIQCVEGLGSYLKTLQTKTGNS